jgi:hypothetical protein
MEREPPPPDEAEPGSEAALSVGVTSRLVSDVLSREVANVDILERVLHGCSAPARKPAVRLSGLFTSFATNRTRGPGGGEYADTVLRERELICEMIRRGFDVRILSSLDIPSILSTWGYRETQVQWRLHDMLEQLKRYAEKYPNFRFAIDTHNRLPGQFIIGRGLLIRSLVATPGVGYSVTAYETDRVEVANAVRTFDEAFAAAERNALAVRKTLMIGTVAGYTHAVLRARLDDAGLELDLGAP